MAEWKTSFQLLTRVRRRRKLHARPRIGMLYRYRRYARNSISDFSQDYIVSKQKLNSNSSKRLRGIPRREVFGEHCEGITDTQGCWLSPAQCSLAYLIQQHVRHKTTSLKATETWKEVIQSKGQILRVSKTTEATTSTCLSPPKAFLDILGCHAHAMQTIAKLLLYIHASKLIAAEVLPMMCLTICVQFDSDVRAGWRTYAQQILE